MKNVIHPANFVVPLIKTFFCLDFFYISIIFVGCLMFCQFFSLQFSARLSEWTRDRWMRRQSPLSRVRWKTSTNSFPMSTFPGNFWMTLPWKVRRRPSRPRGGWWTALVMKRTPGIPWWPVLRTKSSLTTPHPSNTYRPANLSKKSLVFRKKKKLVLRFVLNILFFPPFRNLKKKVRELFFKNGDYFR